MKRKRKTVNCFYFTVRGRARRGATVGPSCKKKVPKANGFTPIIYTIQLESTQRLHQQALQEML